MSSRVASRLRSSDRDRPQARILGQVEVVDAGGTQVALQLQCRKVLALLAIARGRPVSTAQLVRQVWGQEAPSRAAQMVRSHVRVLRSALRCRGEQALTTTPAGYRLDPARCFIDAERFRALLYEARQRLPDDVNGATRAASAALDLWRDADAMPDMAEVQVLRAEAAHLEELRCQAEEMLMQGRLLSGRADLALPALRRLTELYPKRERFWLQLMVAEAVSGRLVEATETTFRRARRHLVEETGLRATSLDAMQRALLEERASVAQLLALITKSSHALA